ncbi:hypothetical protein D3C81_2205150 [compost metagenome]
MAIVANLQLNPFPSQIRLVADQRHFARVRALLEEFRPQGERIQGFRCGRVDYQQHSIGLGDGL